VGAADGGVRPQPIEAIRHAKAANAPIIVAVNKIDKPGVRPERVKQELLQHDIVVESLGGDTQEIEVSATQKTNLDRLLEATPERLQAVEGVGPDRAESIAEWFADDENRRLVEELRSLGLRFELAAGERPREGPATGRASVITGPPPGRTRGGGAGGRGRAWGRLLGRTTCMSLSKTPLQSWNGLLFEQNGVDVARLMAGLGVTQALDFTGYLLDHVEVHRCDYNWKTFIEVYLEDYHVEPFHPGLGNFVTCADLRWEFGEHYSVQTVGINHGLSRFGSPKYKKWQEQVLKFRNGVPPPHGAIWLTLYPNIMVEWYPHVLVVSTVWPDGPQKTINVVEFYYPEEIVLFEREFVEAERAAYMETCIEDDEIGLRMDAGRRILLERGQNEIGPYQSPMEDGMQHFHEWYRKKIAV